MMNNLEIYEKFREVPKEAQKTIGAGRLKGMTDINPMWRIKALTELFGPCGIGWYYKPVRKWIETVDPEVTAFVDIELYIRMQPDGEWSMPIYGTGGSKLATKEKSGIYVSDECYKMATTDAISVACKQLGIGADIYWKGDCTKYDGTGSESKQDKTPEKTPEKTEYVSEAMIRTMCNEVDRIGWNIDGLLKWLKADSMEHITVEKFKFAMEKMKEKQTAPDPSPDPPPEVPEYEGLPFS